MFTSWLWPGCARRAGTAARSAALGRAAVSEEPRPSPHQPPAQTWRLLLVLASAWLRGSQCCQVWGLLRNVRCSVVPPAPSDWWLATSDFCPTTEIASRTSWAECGAVCVPPVPSCVSVLCPSSPSISSSAAVIEVARAFASFPLLRCRNHLYYEVLCTTFDVEANKEIPILSSECRLAFVMQCFLESGFSCWVWEVMLHFRTLAAAELKTSYLVHTLQRMCWTYNIADYCSSPHT